ncbi:hypothetical protein BO94DRAFT_534450 [Aspergillus sclerotioniger CBS 115572]|uniref:Stress-response A/B barrel domain-containing protein n=1 Tax=Aspergillus sclerotioniger CBS 115572 TaxID=1450535 RepID=A0A317WTH0_9EURO|nr:hypothetical protein BO94DRAFT_534450 [Aspergillus sclerotioniger CBS 115572]PWY89703.1 hypothetical protein BO94DRAFT_534450 [Aspergillus sclerotioniger CBS 115572]
MPIFHIVLFRLKKGVSASEVEAWNELGRGMVGKIPAAHQPPLAMTASRAKGFDMGLVAIMEKPEDLQIYANHPDHLKVQELREKLCDDALAYDLEF